MKIFLMTAFDIRDLEIHPGFKEARIDKLFNKKPTNYANQKDNLGCYEGLDFKSKRMNPNLS